ncbi:hypothetical protein RHMOL_Rhmol02G0243600 [Rhododendron molle]|uniref:Uncharacterized protein n=1 Tax=Rhododendron molle TaxID=49168 RepID=A0ACC0PVF5_RHOML|nr:hypothetical protein RHMOL_Rhmol02G0243600 [Rhododendron molle]
MSETNTYLFSPIGKSDFSHMELSVEQLKVKYKENSLTLGKQENLVRYNETKAGQIVVSYVLFVAVMFSLMTSSSSSSSILRRIRWVLFSQILLISASFWLAITMVIKRLVGAKYHFELSLMVRQKLLEEILMVQNGQMKSPEQQQCGRLAKPDPVRLRQWYTNLFAILSPLIAYTVLTLYACIIILLDGK